MTENRKLLATLAAITLLLVGAGAGFVAWILETKAAESQRFSRAGGVADAITAAIAEHVVQTGRDDLIRNEFLALNFERRPCNVPARKLLRNLQAARGVRCKIVSAESPATYLRRKASIAVNVSATMWADPGVRDTMGRLLSDRTQLCRYVSIYAVNPDLAANALGCARNRRLSITVLVRKSAFPDCTINGCERLPPVLQSIPVRTD